MHFPTTTLLITALLTSVSALPIPAPAAPDVLPLPMHAALKRSSLENSLDTASAALGMLRRARAKSSNAVIDSDPSPLRLKKSLSKSKKSKRSVVLEERQGGIDASLVPEFGVQAGVNPDGTGNCDGSNGVKIPCTCPPDRQTFINDLAANVAAGHAVNNTAVSGLTFPTDDSVASQLARFNTATVTLQNLQGPGVGCPQAATTFGAQIKAVQAGQSAASAVNQGAPTPNGSSSSSGSGSGSSSGSSAASPAASSSASGSGDSGASTGGIDASLVPQFGIQAGQQPDGTGNCAGANGVKIPCTCPPDRQTFINDLAENVAAGHAVNNTAVTGLTFPTGSDKASVLARLNAATVTLQNLQGAGVGCPQAATTFGAQVQAAQALAN